MDSSGVSYIAIAISSLSMVIGFVNHKRIRSKCCGKVYDASVDIETTTPPKPIAIP